jgi:hypothetical protein
VSQDPIAIDVLIPVYNEADNIERTLDALAEGIAAVPPGEARFMVTVLYDDPADTTLPALDRIDGKYPFVITRLRNLERGVLGALKTGLRKSACEFMLVTMADLSDDYSVLPGLVQRARAGADVVCPSRYMQGGRQHGGPFLKKLLSRLAGESLHTAAGFPTHDITNSFKLYRKAAVAMLDLQSQGGFEIGMEITAKVHLNGGRVEELPCQWWDRTAGTSRFRILRWLPHYLRWYALVLASPRRPSALPIWFTRLASTVLVLTIAFAAWFSWSPLADPLTARHAFRQAQTAISSWEMARQGLKFAYPTPVLGAPWAIPMEFPLYQWVVTILFKATHLPLEAAGRLVSLICYWAALPLLYRILRTRVEEPAKRLFLVSLVALSPLYLFWPHTFMIETASLALGLAFLACFQTGLRTGSSGWLAWAAALGTLASLVKVTSMPAYDTLALMILCTEAWRHRAAHEPPARLPRTAIAAAFILPFLAAVAWTRYADGIKSLNPLARDFLTSQALNRWNFGTLAQRLTWANWGAILGHTQVLGTNWLDQYLGFPLPVIPAFLLGSLVLGRSRRLEILGCLAAFLVNPLIFVNLHIIHDYYSVPSAFLLTLAVGFALLNLLEAPGWTRKTAGAVTALWIAQSLVCNYWTSYRKSQMAPPPYPAMAAAIERLVPPQGVLLIYGQDWNPTLPFASRHRAIMDRWVLPLGSPRFQASLGETRKDSVQALILPETAPRIFIAERCRYFGFREEPVARAGGDLLFIR